MLGDVATRQHEEGATVAVAPAVEAASSASAAERNAGPAPNPIARFLPSLGDVAFLIPIIFCYARGEGAKTLLGDADTGWHLRTGQWILTHGRVPNHDIFSFTKAGQPWFAWEWLWDVIFGWLHLHWGLTAVVLVNTVLIGAVFTLVYKLAWWKSRNALLSIAVTLAAVAASAMHWLARPHLTTWLFVILFLWVLEHDRAGRTRAVLWLPVLMALWTNLHGGFVAGLILVGAYAAGEVISAAIEVEPEVRARAWASARRYGWLTVACAAASLVNPYGVNLHIHIAKYLTDASIQSGIVEFLPYSFQQPMAKYVEAMVLVACVAAAWYAYRRRFVYSILLVLWAHAGLFSARHIPIFGIVAAPILAAWLTELAPELREMQVAAWLRRMAGGLAGINSEVGEIEQIGRIPVALALATLLLAGLFWAHAGGKFEASFDPKKFPVKAAERLSPSQCAAGVLSTDQWGDYLIYRHYPNIKVFIDGRSDFYGGKFADQYLQVVDAAWNWEKPLNDYGVQTVLLPADTPLNSVLKECRRWRVVYDDHLAVLFERVAGGHEATGALGQGTTIPAVTDGGNNAIARSQTMKPVVHGSQSYARRN
jgi:hypothetical protein